MKVILEYNEETGQLIDANNITIVSWMGIKSFEDIQAYSRTEELLKLFKAGVPVEHLKDLV